MLVRLAVLTEGTDFRTESKKQSDSYALKNNLPILENVLYPRHTGFNHLLGQVRGHVKAVYDVTLVHEVSALRGSIELND